MINFDQIKSIQLEITNRCQASCPMCPRNYNGIPNNPNLKLSDWSLEDYKKIITKAVSDQAQLIYFCGNFGDPIINKDLLEMCKFTAANSPSVEIRIHTNGSARSVSWWQRLATVLPENSTVVFGIDGLADTHSLYRIGTNFETVIKNATAFIQAGGTAVWDFIKFKHNQHQVDSARQMSEDLGFSVFTVKTSNRFRSKTFAVLGKDEEVTHYLEPADDSEMTVFNKDTATQLTNQASAINIKCAAQENSEIYIDALRHVFPCCFTVSLPYFYSRPGDVIHSTRLQFRDEYRALVDRFGGLDAVDATRLSIKDIVNNNKWRAAWHAVWQEKQMTMCSKMCSVRKDRIFSTSEDQFVERKYNSK